MKKEIEKDLFKLVVPEGRCDSRFLSIRNLPENEATRLMMNEVFQKFHDADGNFVEQLQTTGFDARVFELYLFAYLWDGAYDISRDFDRPDFIIEMNGTRVALEATTSNPTAGFNPDEEVTPSSKEDMQEKLLHELPIKLGSPLFSKLRKKYWELPQCKEIPFVLAIEPFHETESLSYSSSSLIQYLYGQKDTVVEDSEGKKSIETSPLSEHRSGSKVIPSGFFSLPDTENISAIIYTNAGTVAKFKRLGFHYGYFTRYSKIMRIGTCYDPDPNAYEPQTFTYDLSEREIEPWGEGLVVCYNPHAKYPLPRSFFVEAAEYYIEGNQLFCDIPKFFPYQSKTFHDMTSYFPLETPPKWVTPITKSFVNLKVIRMEHPLYTELEWYMEKKSKKIGIVLRDNNDEDFSIVLFKKVAGKYEFARNDINFVTIGQARKKLFQYLLLKT
ncbi:hypothetical protein [Paenibacillus sp. V4I3]|uniref:hypothetical protein n=1 Tax=Paenibacillus sp. V4I3 TaxID=3042305 RepID=UPI0027D7C1A0|nr:hypothetical protein [Paenibacillus sp. V4I3]